MRVSSAKLWPGFGLNHEGRHATNRQPVPHHPHVAHDPHWFGGVAHMDMLGPHLHASGKKPTAM